jgi:hypothetical protein
MCFLSIACIAGLLVDKKEDDQCKFRDRNKQPITIYSSREERPLQTSDNSFTDMFGDYTTSLIHTKLSAAVPN